MPFCQPVDGKPYSVYPAKGYHEGRKRNVMGTAFHILCPAYGGPVTPTASLATRLQKSLPCNAHDYQGPVVRRVVNFHKVFSGRLIFSHTVLNKIGCNNIFCRKNVKSFCTAKALHIFRQKMAAVLHIIHLKL